MLTTTLAMAPIDSLRLTGRNQAYRAAQAAGFKLLGGAAHDLILRLSLVSVSTKNAAFLGCTRTDRTVSSCSGHDLQPRHPNAPRRRSQFHPLAPIPVERANGRNGHLRPYAAWSATDCRAPRAVLRGNHGHRPILRCHKPLFIGSGWQPPAVPRDDHHCAA